MKVLNLFPVAEVGGGETVILNLIAHRSSPEIEHEAVIVSDDPADRLEKRLRALGVPCHRLPRGRMRDPLSLASACRGLRELMERIKPDVYLSNSAQGFLYGKLASVGLHVPGALYQMSVPQPGAWKQGPLDWATRLARPDVLFAASGSIREKTKRWGKSGSVTVYHGTGIPRTTAEEAAGVEEKLRTLGVGPEQDVVLMPGRLQPWKGQSLFLKAFKEISARHPRAIGIVLGDAFFGQDEEFPDQLRREITELGLGQRVFMLPHQPIAPWLRRASVVVHASLGPDAFPNVCIEAMAAQTALVTNELAGTAEILKPGTDALVVPAARVAPLADALDRLLTDPQLRRQIAEAGHRRYLETCTPERMVSLIESHLLELAPRESRRMSA